MTTKEEAAMDQIDEQQAVRVLDAIDDATKTKLTWRQIRTVLISSVGFFMDSYDIFVINLIVPMLGFVYYGPADKYTVPANISGPLKGMTNVGNLIGQVTFGILGDALGRHAIYGVELVIIIIGTFGYAMAGAAATGVGVLGFVGFWRLLLGFGIGGDYPMSATVSAEWAAAGRRGQMLALTFSMQGWGQFFGPLCDIILLSIFHSAIDDSFLNIDYVWRILAALGVVPALFSVYYRFALPESPHYSANVLKDEEKVKESLAYVNVVAAPTVDEQTDLEELKRLQREKERARKRNHFREFSAHFSQWKHLKPLIGTTVTWFLLDIAFYGISLNQPVILQAINFAGSPSATTTTEQAWQILFKQGVGNLIISLLGAIPGYYVTVFTIEILGRKTIQIIGFAAETILFIIIAAAYTQLKANAEGAFVFLFVLVQFFFQFGANSTTFIVPAEIFPTRFRATAHGISAACGKAGAIIAAFGFNVVVNIGGTNAFLPQTLGIFAAIMFVGLLFTFLIPESKGKGLHYFEEDD